MQPDTALARVCTDLFHRSRFEHFMIPSTDRTFDHDRTDRRLNAPARRALDPAPDFRDVKRALTWRERNEVEPAECLRAVATVVVQVAFCRDQHPAIGACQLSDREVICQGAGRYKDGGLFPQQLRKLALQLRDSAAVAVVIGLRYPFRCELAE